MIERATAEHLRMLALAGKEAIKDMPLYKDCPFDVDHSIAVVEQFMKMPELACFFKQVNGKVVGLFMGVLGAHWFTPMKEMTELIFWVHEDYRKEGLALKLLDTAEEWAISNGAKKITLASGTGYKTDIVMRFYRRRGYHLCGVSACKEV